MKNSFKNWRSITESNSSTIIFSAGLDNRSGDKTLAQQTKLLEDATGRKVEGFRYNDQYGLLREISANPDSPVILFSAGCKWADQVAKSVSNLNHVYIIEPYAVNSDGEASLAVKAAVEAGVPASNVMAGPRSSRGKGVVDGHSNTDSGIDHWGSIAVAGKKYIGSGGSASASYGGTTGNTRHYRNF
jgi:hypothetical protein